LEGSLRIRGLLGRLTVYIILGSIFSTLITIAVLYFVLHITGVPPYRITRTLLFAGAVVGLAFTLPIFFVRAVLYKLLIEKINRMIEAMDRVSRGDIDTPVEPQTNDEFGQMAEAFERMRVSVKEMIVRLEEEIERRRR